MGASLARPGPGSRLPSFGRGTVALVLGGLMMVACTTTTPATQPPTTTPPATATATAAPTALPTASPTTAATASPTTAAAPSPSASPTPTPTSQTGAPDELAGVWLTTLTAQDVVTLTLRDNRYTIERGPQVGTGRIDVTGDTIVFSGSDLCAGEGVYAWTVEGIMLTFSRGQPEACGGRGEVISEITYRRLAP